MFPSRTLQHIVNSEKTYFTCCCRLMGTQWWYVDADAVVCCNVITNLGVYFGFFL